MAGENELLGDKLLHGIERPHEKLRVVEIRGLVTHLAEDLRKG